MWPNLARNPHGFTEPSFGCLLGVLKLHESSGESEKVPMRLMVVVVRSLGWCCLDMCVWLARGG